MAKVKTKKGSARRNLAKKTHARVEHEELLDDETTEANEAVADAAVMADARETPLSETEAAAVARVPSAPATRKAPSWAGLLPGIIVVGLIALAVIVQLVMG